MSIAETKTQGHSERFNWNEAPFDGFNTFLDG